MKNLIGVIDSEINASKKNEKPIFIELFKDENSYKGFFGQKMEGEFILTSKGIDETIVQLKYSGGIVTVSGIESEENKINAFLQKDNASILRAVKEKLGREDLPVPPHFLIGPPGTGKSTVIVEAIKNCIRGQRILVLSPTNMAIENVFERLNIDELGLNEGELILNIKTENDALQEYSLDTIQKNRKTRIEDEEVLLEGLKEEIAKSKRDLETVIAEFESKIEQKSIFTKNILDDKREFDVKLRKEIQEKNELEKRILSLENNTILNNISKLFTAQNGRLDELKNKLSFCLSSIEKLEKTISQKNQVLEKAKLDDIDEDLYQEKKDELSEVMASYKTVTSRLKEIKEESSVLVNGNIFQSAKLVGATLVSAATNKKLQMAEFDKILIDESSMALFPYILSASQCLNNKEIANVQIIHNNKLTFAQNQGVELLVNSKLGLIGDPKQLTAIAVTNEMKQSVFDIYNIGRLFDGESVENTILLDINFRNQPDIVQVASKLFYGGLLKAGKKDTGIKSLYILKNKSNMTSMQSSFVNHGNCEIVIDQISKALRKGRRSIGVVTPYKEQANLINKKLQPLKELYSDADIQAGTIHKFQGKEKDVIIFDLCFSTSENTNIPKAYDGNEVSETAKLLNVAMTRAETFFILIGDVDGIKALEGENLILKKWIKEIENL